MKCQFCDNEKCEVCQMGGTYFISCGKCGATGPQTNDEASAHLKWLSRKGVGAQPEHIQTRFTPITAQQLIGNIQDNQKLAFHCGDEVFRILGFQRLSMLAISALPHLERLAKMEQEG